MTSPLCQSIKNILFFLHSDKVANYYNKTKYYFKIRELFLVYFFTITRVTSGIWVSTKCVFDK